MNKFSNDLPWECQPFSINFQHLVEISAQINQHISQIIVQHENPIATKFIATLNCPPGTVFRETRTNEFGATGDVLILVAV